VILGAPSSAAPPPSEDLPQRVEHALVAQGVTPDAAAAGRERAFEAQLGPNERERENPGMPGSAGPAPRLTDRALQTSTATSGTGDPASLIRGLGLDGGMNVQYAPPDTNGAVGDSYYVQAVNARYAVYYKEATGTGANPYLKFGPALGSSLFQALKNDSRSSRCATRDDGDPVVQYDRSNQRWIFTQFVADKAPYLECVAVSKTSDPTGAYRVFAYDYGKSFPDYPKVGVWPGSYLITYNLFTNARSFAGAEICALDRAAMVTDAVTPKAQQCWKTGTSYGGLLPSDVDGATQPTGAAYVVNRTGSALKSWRLTVDWSAPTASVMTAPQSVTAVEPFNPPCTGACVPQPGTSQRLDTLGDRVMYRLAYRNWMPAGGTPVESLVLTHAVSTTGLSGAPTAVRWYELRPAGGGLTAYQQGTFAPNDGLHRWMSSAAMTSSGAIGVGYSASGAAVGAYPSIRWAARDAGDTLGVLRNEVVIAQGTGSQTTNLSRWGDYASMSVDPSDDCTMWFTTEVLSANGTWNWNTRIAKLKPPGCV
jgi:hypothetical protein